MDSGIKGFAQYVWVFKRAIKRLAAIRAIVFRKVMAPMLLLIVLDIVAVASPNEIINWLASLLCFLPYILIAVTVHRLIILGLDASVGSWTSIETKFLWYSLALSLTFVAIIIVMTTPIVLVEGAGLLSVLYSGCVMIFAVWVYSRLIIILPSIAIERDFSLGAAWTLSEKYQVLMFITCVIGPAFMGLLTVPLPIVLSSLANSFFVILNVAILSYCFRLIVYETADEETA